MGVGASSCRAVRVNEHCRPLKMASLCELTALKSCGQGPVTQMESCACTPQQLHALLMSDPANHPPTLPAIPPHSPHPTPTHLPCPLAGPRQCHRRGLLHPSLPTQRLHPSSSTHPHRNTRPDSHPCPSPHDTHAHPSHTHTSTRPELRPPDSIQQAQPVPQEPRRPCIGLGRGGCCERGELRGPVPPGSLGCRGLRREPGVGLWRLWGGG